MVVIYRIYRITASARYLAHYLVQHLAHYLVQHLAQHLAVASFLLMTQPTAAAVAPAAVAPAAVVALVRAQ